MSKSDIFAFDHRSSIKKKENSCCAIFTFEGRVIVVFTPMKINIFEKRKYDYIDDPCFSFSIVFRTVPLSSETFFRRILQFEVWRLMTG